MSSVTTGTIALVGAGFVLFALISIARGRYSYSEGEGVRKSIVRSERPQTFWITTLGLLAAGAVMLAVAAYFFLRR